MRTIAESRRIRVLFLFVLLGFGTVAALAAGRSEVAKLADDYYEESLILFPLRATSDGDYRYNDRLTIEISSREIARQRAAWTKYLARLDNLSPETMSDEDRLTASILGYQLRKDLEALDYPADLIPMRQIYSFPLTFTSMGSGIVQPFRNTKDYDDFLGRIRQFPNWVDVAIENMRFGLKQGVVQPRIVIEKTLPQLSAVLVDDPEASLFFKPLKDFPPNIGPERGRLTQEYTHAIKSIIVPAYRKLYDYLKDDYLPRCRETTALSDLPRGREWYQFLVRQTTTTTLTPDEIFELGEREVQRIRSEMEAVRARDGFQGDLKAFAKYAESKEQRATTKDELQLQYNALRGKIEARLPQLFGIISKAPYEIRPIEEYRENSSPTHYIQGTPDGSRPGIFYFNGKRLSEGPMPVSEATFLHEAIPGHHFQISIAQENDRLPKFRRFGRYTAYSEGWGLYAESLGYELDCYQTPYQKMDRLSAEMWRARRLVVDVGLHWKAWPRDKAIHYMEENPVLTLPPALEVDRYIAMPSQALAYKIGEIKIREFRAMAEKALGRRFDQRKFHDQILASGAMPLDVLEQRITRWLENAK